LVESPWSDDRRLPAPDAKRFPDVGLGLVLWTGTFEGQQQTWLRRCDKDGRVIPTGAERLAAQLRALGVEPES
jgi:hypothetical protein